MADNASAASNAAQHSLTLWAALKDLGWFAAVFAMVIGGPSALSILQAVFVEHQLIAAFQWIVDGWNGILAIVSAIVEPLFSPILSWLNATFGWSLALHPHWRPLFALYMIYQMAGVRAAMQAGLVFKAIVVGAVGALAVLLGALGAGLAPLTGGWWAQGLAAGLPLALVMTANLFNMGATGTGRSEWETARGLIAYGLAAVVTFSAAAFLAAAALSFAPVVGQGAGAIVLSLAVAGIGVQSLVVGFLSADRVHIRIGFMTLGGFIAAGLILVADAAVKTWG